jgi:hypothetical protein
VRERRAHPQTKTSDHVTTLWAKLAPSVGLEAWLEGRGPVF